MRKMKKKKGNGEDGISQDVLLLGEKALTIAKKLVYSYCKTLPIENIYYFSCICTPRLQILI